MSSSETSYFVFVASDVDFEKRSISSVEAIKLRLEKGYWAISQNARMSSSLQKGDKVVFYAGQSGGSSFIAAAQLASAVVRLPKREREQLESTFDRFVFAAPTGVLLEDAVLFPQHVSAKALLGELTFTKDIRYWGIYFMGSIVGMNAEDYRLILNEAGAEVDE